MIIRKLKLKDDLNKVARLIMESDIYLYEDVSEELLVKLIKNDTLFNYEHITICINDNLIVGAMLSITNKSSIVFDYTRYNLPNTFIESLNEYFFKISFDTCNYIISITVDKEYRGKGIAKTLIESLKSSSSLDVLASNLKAINAYESYGFYKVCQYYGYPDVSSIKMTNLKAKMS